MVMIEYIWLRGVERFQFEVSVIPIVVTRPVYNMPTDFLPRSYTDQGAFSHYGYPMKIFLCNQAFC